MMPRTLFQIVFIALLGFNFSYSFSQEVVMKGEYPDSKDVYWNDIFQINDNATFYLINSDFTPLDIELCTWQINVVVDGSMSEVKRVKNNNTKYDFVLDKEVANTIKSQGSIIFENEGSVYNIIQIRCLGTTKTGKSFDQNFFIYLNYLPPIPKIEILDVEWESYSKEWDIYDDLLVTVKCRTEGANKYIVTVNSDEFMHGTYRFELDFTGGQDTHTMHIRSSLSLIEVLAENEYGKTLSKIHYNLKKFIKDKNATSIGQEDKSESKLRVYPNPVKEVLYIDTDEETVKNIRISDITGKSIMQIENPTSNEINVQNLIKGTYLLSIECQDKSKNKRVKFMKE